MSALSDLPVCGRVWDIFPQSPLSPRTEQAGANGAPICRISLCGGTRNRRKRAQDTSRHSQHLKKGRRGELFGPFYAGSRARRQSRGAAARAGARRQNRGAGGKGRGADGKGRGAAAELGRSGRTGRGGRTGARTARAGARAARAGARRQELGRGRQEPGRGGKGLGAAAEQERGRQQDVSRCRQGRGGARNTTRKRPGFPRAAAPTRTGPYPFRATITSLYIDWSTRCASSSHGPPSIT